MANFKEMLSGKAGPVIAGVIILVGGFLIWNNASGSFTNPALADNYNRLFICAETGKEFRYGLKLGDTIPVKSPYSGKETGFEAEACFWTKDGKPTEKPTYVLLNSHKGGKEPTFCPDCGRLVRPLNPPAGEGTQPPPTEAELKARK